MESNSCKLAECVAIFKDLQYELTRSDVFARNARTKTLFESRFSSTITPAHYAAVLVSAHWNPKIVLTAQEKQYGIGFMEENFNLTFMPMFYKFQGQLPPFPKSSFLPASTESMTDYEWWKMQASMFPNLVTAANMKNIEMLTTAVASSAGIERTFSKYGMIQSKLRNKLGSEKAAKLVFINQKLNCINKKKNL